MTRAVCCCCCSHVLFTEVEQQILASGISSCQIYRVQNRLCMILETADDFSFKQKAAADAAHQKTIEWEELMWKYQKAITGTQGKWQLMTKIYELVGA